ncbi:hypothetical protein BOX15_Mlig005294g2 [Macrostomum lignano]|uniref:TTL domain-containing protein n=2 Tax=Macrostomum lignano TaxID=282301 RepID=A0A267DEM3_9PLAT|nr:hypothetical protein BOX15_Mlig005294g2 [Macrostomum lignano]
MAKHVIFIPPNTNQSSTVDQQGDTRPDNPRIQQAAILSNPYRLQDVCSAIREKYIDDIGLAVQATGLGGNRFGPNTSDVVRVTNSIGFSRIREDEAVKEADNFDEEDGKLNVALSIPRNNPAFNRPNCLTMRPFTEPMNQLCSKSLLVRWLRLLEGRLVASGQAFRTASGGLFGYEEFTALTLSLSDANLEQKLGQNPGTYLAKPSRGTMGQMQKLVQIGGPDEVRRDLLIFLRRSQYRRMRLSHVILQRYIDPPLLVDKRKFDMRVYYLIVNTRRQSSGVGGRPETGYFAFLHPGFVRLCSSPYDPSDLKNLALHLTNQSVQARQSELFSELKEATTWYPDELNAYLNRRGRLGEMNWARDVLYPKVAAILGYVSALYKEHLEDRDFAAGAFRIMGVDMLVDAKLRVYLLEFNEFPSWGRRTDVLKRVKPNMWLEAVALAAETSLRFRRREPINSEADLLAAQNFRLAFSSDAPQLARDRIAQLYP